MHRTLLNQTHSTDNAMRNLVLSSLLLVLVGFAAIVNAVSGQCTVMMMTMHDK